jgi:hypothetical protein
LVDQVLAQPGDLVLRQLSGHGGGATRRDASAGVSASAMSRVISDEKDEAR